MRIHRGSIRDRDRLCQAPGQREASWPEGSKWGRGEKSGGSGISQWEDLALAWWVDIWMANGEGMFLGV